MGRKANYSLSGKRAGARRTTRYGLAAALLAGLFGLAGCGVYSASTGRVSEDIRRVAVPYLENRTSEPNIEVELTDAIIAAIQQDNTLQVVDELNADSVLRGQVTRYQLREAFASQDLTVDEYQVQITVALTFLVKSTGKALFENKRFTGTGNYVLDDPQTDEATARALAAREIVSDVLAQVVEEW
jgi:hypothetical protein